MLDENAKFLAAFSHSAPKAYTNIVIGSVVHS